MQQMHVEHHGIGCLRGYRTLVGCVRTCHEAADWRRALAWASQELSFRCCLTTAVSLSTMSSSGALL